MPTPPSRGRAWTACASRHRGGRGDRTGPTARGKAEPKRRVAADQAGIPFAACSPPADTHASVAFAATVDAGPLAKRLCSRPRGRPKKARADKAQHYRRCRAVARRRHTKGRIALFCHSYGRSNFMSSTRNRLFSYAVVGITFGAVSWFYPNLLGRSTLCGTR